MRRSTILALAAALSLAGWVPDSRAQETGTSEESTTATGVSSSEEASAPEVVIPEAASQAAPAELVDKVVAVVNREVILHSEVTETLSYVEESELQGLSGEALEVARGELVVRIVDGLIGQRLVDQAMERAAIEVEDREVEAAVVDVASQNGMSPEELIQQVALQGMSETDYRTELKDQLRQFKFMNLEIRARVTVPEEDIRNRYNQQVAESEPDPAWRLQRILLAFAQGDGAAREKVEVEAGVLLGQLQGGKDFGEIAKLRSDDASTRDRGGEVGLIKPRDLAPSFAESLSQAEVGASVRVDTDRGVFLLRVAEVVDAAVPAFEDRRSGIARELYDAAMERELERWTAEERRKAHVELFL